MVPDKLDPKYRLPIWLGLFFATFVCNFYDIYFTCADMAATGSELGRIGVAIGVVQMLFADLIVPALLVVLFAYLVYQIGSSRFVRCISRRDFTHWVMLFISASRLVMGFVNVFGIINANVNYCTTGFLSTLCNGAAMLTMFFAVFKRVYRFNPAEEYNAFKAWATVFMIGGGIHAIIGNGAALILLDSPELLFELFGIDLSSNIVAITAGCVTGMVVYFAYLVAIIALGEIMKKKARAFIDPQTRGDYYAYRNNAPYTTRTDANEVFGDDAPAEQTDSDDDKVFEEFEN